ncbi:hypothetical protein PENARI_c002G11639 [Penicillium arizonense]|uniref:Uncharacterized protein n=1 Tax=Penicillium arizonense TaxID=1835702 RepID=A0A1F5LWQ7_PENAI|nr:hypothetical protein PENARI_c002G11639 [Penicillium arizonense]OGE57593.1 hypothetical protein PENARI_c002G11639 [Penicillium arizonense]
MPSPLPKDARRSLATTKPSEQQGDSSKWIMVSIALGVPLSIYLWRKGDTKKPNNDAVGEHRGANQEYTQNAEGNQSVERQPSDTNSSAHDEPRAMGPAKGPTSMSFKQQGLSNTDTMNPYINEPGKSQKGEGETETAKVKGTVKPDRPQA